MSEVSEFFPFLFIFDKAFENEVDFEEFFVSSPSEDCCYKNFSKMSV